MLVFRCYRSHCGVLNAGLAEKSKHVTSLGMVTLLDDVALQHHRLLRQYLEAESASLNHFEQVEKVGVKVAAALEQAALVKGRTSKIQIIQTSSPHEVKLIEEQYSVFGSSSFLCRRDGAVSTWGNSHIHMLNNCSLCMSQPLGSFRFTAYCLRRCSTQLLFASAGEEMPSTEFEELRQSIQGLKTDFKKLARPEGLPPPGERLMPMRDTTVVKQPKEAHPQERESAVSPREALSRESQELLAQEGLSKADDKSASAAIPEQVCKCEQSAAFACHSAQELLLSLMGCQSY